MKRYQVVLIAVNTFLSALLLIILTVLLFRHWPDSGAASTDYALDFEELKLYIDDLTSQNQELMNKLESISKDLSGMQTIGRDTEVRALLPKGYVEQIDSFFEDKKAQGLLSEKAAKRGFWKFGKPHLLSPDLLVVDYVFSGQTENLLVSIGTVDYTDLEFKVLWDSFEIRR